MKKNGTILRKLFLSSVVSVIAAAIAAMMGIVVDGVVIGRYLGPDCMAAYGVATPIVNFVNIFSGVLSTGAQVVCAQRLGAGDVKGARRVFSMCMLAALTVSAVLLAGILIFRREIVVFLGARDASAHLLPYASDYVLGLAFALPSIIFLFIFNTLLRLDGDAGRVMIAVAVMTVLDIAGDFLNALVLHGGMLGMGLATSISYFIALIIILLHFRKKDILFRFSARGLRWKDLRDILGIGSSSAVGSASSMLRNTILNRIMVATALSGTAVGALGIVNTVYGFTSSTMIGVGLTAAMIAGMILGEQDRTAAEELVRITVAVALALGAALGVVLFAFSDGIAGAFGNEDGAEMVALAARGLRFYAVSIALYGINNAFVNYTQGIRRMGYSTIFCFLQNFVFVALPALALRGLLETDAVWSAFIVGEVLTLLAICSCAAVRKRGVPCRARDFLFVREPFGASESDVFELSITDGSQVIPASQAVAEFCAGKNAGPKERMLLPLFVEELGNNVTRYGFASKKRPGLDVRVVRQGDGWIVRLRDNGRSFDPTAWLELHKSDDPTANIGIRMVCGMAKEVTYVSTMNLNNLTIHL